MRSTKSNCEKQHWHKSTLWEEATRVPLIIDAPGYGSGVCDQPVSLLDLYPTLTELAEPAPIDSHDGVSLERLLRNPRTSWNRPAVIEFQQGNAAVRSDRFRYIRYHDGGEELYDHQSDPYEWNNLASDPQHAEVIEKLRGWITEEWARPALTKSAFEFDHETFTWTNRTTGQKVSGHRN